MLNEQWCEASFKNYNIESKVDTELRTNKVNASILIHESEQFTRHRDLEAPNSVVVYCSNQQIWFICAYMRPREHDFNEEVLATLANSLEHILNKELNSNIIFAADLNHEDDMVDLYLGDYLQRCEDFSGPNHFGNPGTTPNTLSAIYSNIWPVEISQIEQSRNLSDHIAMKFTYESSKGRTPSRSYVPNRNLAQYIQKSILRDQGWQLHQQYPSSSQRRKRVKNVNNELKSQARLQQVIDLLKDGYTIDRIESTLNSQWNTFRNTTVATMFNRYGLDEDLKTKWRKFRAVSGKLLKPKLKIANQIIDKNGALLSGMNMVKLLAKEYARLTAADDPEFMQTATSYPADYDLPDEWTTELSNNMSQGKALTFDCIPDTLFRLRTEDDPKHTHEDKIKIKIAKDIFQEEFWSQKAIDLHLRGRLIPVSKLKNGVPKVEDIRFIVCLSAVHKAAEIMLLKPLKKYCEENMTHIQRGFIKGFSTHKNIVELIEELKDGKEALFIDLRSAFDQVIRSKLYDILQEKQILNTNELSLLKFLHSNSTVSVVGQVIKPSIGVPQGSKLSPFLFNIYVFDLLVQLNTVGKCLAWADDIVITAKKNDDLKMAEDVINDWSKVNKIKLNSQKSAYFSSKSQNSEIETAIEYKYLGILIGRNGNTKTHLQNMRKLLYMKASMIRRTTLINRRVASILYKLTIRPIIQYSQEAVKGGKNSGQQIEVLRRIARVAYRI